MNISRLSSVPASAQPASVRPFQSTTKATGAERRTEATEDRRPEHQPRVAEFASQIDTRLQNVIAEGNLSDDQIQELKAAAAQFQALMSRIGSADFSAAPMRQVLFAIGQLGEHVQKVVHAGHTILATRRIAPYLFELPAEEQRALWEAAREVAALLKCNLPCERVCVAVVGWEVRHVHVHLVPTDAPGEFPPLGGAEASADELDWLAQRIRTGRDPLC